MTTSPDPVYAAGPRPAGFTFTYAVQTRLSDFDMQHHLNNVTYVRYVESARMAHNRTVLHGAPRSVDEGEGGWVLAEVRCRYKAPIPYTTHDILVHLRLQRVGTSSLTYAFQVQADLPEAPLAAEGEAVQVHVDRRTGRPRPLPQAWRERLLAFEREHGNQPETPGADESPVPGRQSPDRSL